MNQVSEAAVRDALRAVQDPDLHRDIVTLGFVKTVAIDGGSVAVQVELTTPACPVKDLLQQQCEDVVSALPGVDTVEITMTAQVRERRPQGAELLPGVKNCVAIASGKGGVGKSTVSLNLAIALAQSGARVGLMDADVYGPSIPLMMGLQHARPTTDGEKIQPIRSHGISMMSLGLLLEEGQAVLWRGPMVASTIRQLLSDVAWGDLDYLLVDLPPGTGDAPMSLAQLAPLAGVVIVTTPHHVAANIAGKSAALFRRLNSPILGVIENMAEFACPECGTISRLFHGTTGEELAQSIGTPFLGSIPLDPRVGEAVEAGVPSLLEFPDRPQAEGFRKVAGNMAAQLSISSVARTASDASKVAEGKFEPASTTGPSYQ